MENTIIEIKNKLEGIDSTWDKAEDQICALEVKVAENTQVRKEQSINKCQNYTQCSNYYNLFLVISWLKIRKVVHISDYHFLMNAYYALRIIWKIFTWMKLFNLHKQLKLWPSFFKWRKAHKNMTSWSHVTQLVIGTDKP